MFYLRNGRFVILSFSPFDQAGTVAAVYRRFQESWLVGGAEMFVGVGCAVMDSSICLRSVSVNFKGIFLDARFIIASMIFTIYRTTTTPPPIDATHTPTLLMISCDAFHKRNFYTRIATPKCGSTDG